jgi:hypothetical protein
VSLPYERATSGKAALGDIQKILKEFGAKSFGSMEDFETGDLLIQFEWRDRKVSLKASAKGYAAAYLKHHPWSSRMRSSRIDYERKALEQGMIAVYSILRDWIKGQITAVETGILSFEGAFLGQILLASGRTVLEEAEDTILKLEGPKP